MAIFRARFGGGLRFLGLLALAGLSDTDSARAMGGPPTDPNDAIIWQQDIPTQFLGAAPIQLDPPFGIPTSFSAVPAGVCAVVDNNMLQIIGVGTCTVTASLTVGSGSPIQREKTFNIVPAATNKLSQEPLSIDAPQNLTYNETQPFSVSGGSGTGAVNTAVSEGCVLSEYSVTAVSGTGTCTITVTKAGDATYDPATDTAEITLLKVSQIVIWPATTTYAVGDSINLTSITLDSGLTPSISVNTPQVCSTNGAQLTFNQPGSCAVTASHPGTDIYAEVTGGVPFNFTVTGPPQKKAQTITWGQTLKATIGDNPFTLDATASSFLPVSYEAQPDNRCTIESGNELQIQGSGDCTVTASQGGNAEYDAAANVSQTFTIAKIDQLALNFTIAPLAVGQEITLSASGGAGNGEVIFAVAAGSTGFCELVSADRLKGKAPGTCEVTATKQGDNNYNPVEVTATVQVGKGAQSALQVVAASTMSFPGTLSLSTSGGTGTGAVTYQVSGPCTISGNILTSKDPGTCQVTATKESDGTYESVTSSPLVVEVVSSGGSNIAITSCFGVIPVSSVAAPCGTTFTQRASILSFSTLRVSSGRLNWFSEENGSAGQGSIITPGGPPTSSFTAPRFVQSGFAFLPQGSSTNGMIAFSGSAGQIVHAAGKGDKQVMPTSAQRPDQGYDPYVRMAGSFDIWIDGRFSWSNGADGEGGLDSKTFVTETGVDYLMTESLLIGLSLRVDNSDGTFGGEGGELEMRGWLAGPYVVWEITPGLQADAKIGYGGGHNDISAIIGGENYGGSYDTTRWRAAAGLRGELEFGSFMIEPGLRAGFYRETTEAFTLSNDGGTVVEQEFTFLRLSFDPRLTYRHVTEEGTSITPFLSPQIAAQWQDARGGRSNWDVFGVVQGGFSIATEDFSLSTNLAASGLGGEGAVSYSAGANLTIPLN